MYGKFVLNRCWIENVFINTEFSWECNGFLERNWTFFQNQSYRSEDNNMVSPSKINMTKNTKKISRIWNDDSLI